MPTATLTFTLPKEESEFRLAVNANLAFVAHSDLDDMCRNLLKHGNTANLTWEQIAQHVRNEIADALAQGVR